MAEEKQSFIMYASWATLLAGLPEEDAGQIIKAICSKKLGREYEITSQTAQAVFDMIAPQLDEDAAKYQETCEKRKAAIRKRWGNDNKCTKEKNECSTNVTPKDTNVSEKNTNVSKENTSVSEKNTNVIQMYSDTDSESESDSESDSDTPNGVYKASAKADARDTRVSHADIDSAISSWNTLPDPVPKVTKLSAQSARAKSLRARISQYGLDEVMRAIKNVRNSPFLLGQVKDFVITFDWFVKPNNFSKVLDGNYLGRDAPSERSGTAYGMSQQDLDEGAARIEAAMALERGELYGKQ